MWPIAIDVTSSIGGRVVGPINHGLGWAPR